MVTVLYKIPLRGIKGGLNHVANTNKAHFLCNGRCVKEITRRKVPVAQRIRKNLYLFSAIKSVGLNTEINDNFITCK